MKKYFVVQNLRNYCCSPSHKPCSSSSSYLSHYLLSSPSSHHYFPIIIKNNNLFKNYHALLSLNKQQQSQPDEKSNDNSTITNTTTTTTEEKTNDIFSTEKSENKPSTKGNFVYYSKDLNSEREKKKNKAQKFSAKVGLKQLQIRIKNQQEQQPNNKNNKNKNNTGTTKKITEQEEDKNNEIKKEENLLTMLNEYLQNEKSDTEPNLTPNEKIKVNNAMLSLRKLKKEKYIVELHSLFFSNQEILEESLLFSTGIDEKILDTLKSRLKELDKSSYLPFLKSIIYLNQLHYIEPIVDAMFPSKSSSMNPTIQNTNDKLAAILQKEDDMIFIDILIYLERKITHMLQFPRCYPNGAKKGSNELYLDGIIKMSQKEIVDMVSDELKEKMKSILNIFNNISKKHLNFDDEKQISTYITCKTRIFRHLYDPTRLKQFYIKSVRPALRFISIQQYLVIMNEIISSLRLLKAYEFIVKDIYSHDLNIHYENLKAMNIRKLVGYPLFVGFREFLKSSPLTKEEIHTAKELILLASEIVNMLINDQAVSSEFTFYFCAILKKQFFHYLDPNRKPYLKIEEYFNFYLEYLAHFYFPYREYMHSSLPQISYNMVCIIFKLISETKASIGTKEAEFVHDLLKKEGFPIQPLTFIALSAIYSNSKKVDLITKLREETNIVSNYSYIIEGNDEDVNNGGEHVIFDPREFKCISLASSYSVVGDFDGCYNMIVELLERPTKLATHGINILFKCILTISHINMRTPNIYIEYCLQKTLDLVDKHQIVFDGITLNTLITLYGHVGKLDLMLQNLNILMQYYKTKDPKFEPYLNVVTFTSVIKQLCASLRYDEAYKLLDEMKSLKIAPTSITYRAIIEGMTYCGKDYLKQIINRMKSDNITLDENILAAILYHLAVFGKEENQVLYIIDIIKNRDLFDSKIYEHIILYYSNKLNFEKVIEHLTDMIKIHKIPPTPRLIQHIASRTTSILAIDTLEVLLLFLNRKDFDYYLTHKRGDALNGLSYDWKELGISKTLINLIKEYLDFEDLETKMNYFGKAHYLNNSILTILGFLYHAKDVPFHEDVLIITNYFRDLFRISGIIPDQRVIAMFLQSIFSFRGPLECLLFFNELLKESSNHEYLSNTMKELLDLVSPSSSIHLLEEYKEEEKEERNGKENDKEEKDEKVKAMPIYLDTNTLNTVLESIKVHFGDDFVFPYYRKLFSKQLQTNSEHIYNKNNNNNGNSNNVKPTIETLLILAQSCNSEQEFNEFADIFYLALSNTSKNYIVPASLISTITKTPTDAAIKNAFNPYYTSALKTLVSSVNAIGRRMQLIEAKYVRERVNAMCDHAIQLAGSFDQLSSTPTLFTNRND
ncbi:hypothetical protein ABK040_016065 [Willaertia magna]